MFYPTISFSNKYSAQLPRRLLYDAQDLMQMTFSFYHPRVGIKGTPTEMFLLASFGILFSHIGISQGWLNIPYYHPRVH